MFNILPTPQSVAHAAFEEFTKPVLGACASGGVAVGLTEFISIDKKQATLLQTRNPLHIQNCAPLCFDVSHNEQTNVQWSQHPLVLKDGSMYILENWSKAMPLGCHVWVRFWFRFHIDEQERVLEQIEARHTSRRGEQCVTEFTAHHFTDNTGKDSIWIDYKKSAAADAAPMLNLLEEAVTQSGTKETQLVRALGWDNTVGDAVNDAGIHSIHPLATLMSSMSENDSILFNSSSCEVWCRENSDTSVRVDEHMWVYTKNRAVVEMTAKIWDEHVLVLHCSQRDCGNVVHEQTAWFVHSDKNTSMSSEFPNQLHYPLSLNAGADCILDILRNSAEPRSQLPPNWQLIVREIRTHKRWSYSAWKEPVGDEVLPSSVLHVECWRIRMSPPHGDIHEFDEAQSFAIDVWQAPGVPMCMTRDETAVCSTRLCDAASTFGLACLFVPWYILLQGETAAIHQLFFRDTDGQVCNKRAFQSCIIMTNKHSITKRWIVTPLCTTVTQPIITIEKKKCFGQVSHTILWTKHAGLQVSVAKRQSMTAMTYFLTLKMNRMTIRTLRMRVSSKLRTWKLWLRIYDPIKVTWTLSPPLVVNQEYVEIMGHIGVADKVASAWSDFVEPQSLEVGRQQWELLKQADILPHDEGSILLPLLFAVLPASLLGDALPSTLGLPVLQTKQIEQWSEDDVLSVPSADLYALIRDTKSSTIVQMRSHNHVDPDHVTQADAKSFMKCVVTDAETKHASQATSAKPWHLFRQEFDISTNVLNLYVVSFQGAPSDVCVSTPAVDGQGSSKSSTSGTNQRAYGDDHVAPISFAQQSQHQGYGSMSVRAQLNGSGDGRLVVARADPSGRVRPGERLLYKVLLCLHPSTGELSPCIACLDITKSEHVAFHGASEKLRAETATVRWIRTIRECHYDYDDANRSPHDAVRQRWFIYERDLRVKNCAVCLERTAGVLFQCSHAMCHTCYDQVCRYKAASAELLCHLCRTPVSSVRFIISEAMENAVHNIDNRLDDSARGDADPGEEDDDDDDQDDQEQRALINDQAVSDQSAPNANASSSVVAVGSNQPPTDQVNHAISFLHSSNMLYEPGKTYFIHDFDKRLSHPCSQGIHGFLSDTAHQMRVWVIEHFHGASRRSKERWRSVLEGHVAAASSPSHAT